MYVPPTGHNQRSAGSLHVARAALGIAGSADLKLLAEECFRHMRALTGAQAVGLYLFEDGAHPEIVTTDAAPPGFLAEYEAELRPHDPILHYLRAERRAVDGFGLIGAADWPSSNVLRHLQHWGFAHNIQGPIIVGGQVCGTLNAASSHPKMGFSAHQVQMFDLLCQAASLAVARLRLGRIWHDPCPMVPARMMDMLPRRSRDVAELLCAGLSNKAIGSSLGISPYTVKDHVSALCRRAGAQNRTDLVHRLAR